jgi:SPP1 gp7 family putative phage head morphogenesis protein
MDSIDAAGGPTKESLAAPAPVGVDEELVRETEQLLTISYLLGRDHVGTKLELADDPEVPAIPFDDAVKFLKARVPLTKAEWLKLEPELRFRAFTVAALSAPDAIDRVRRMAADAVEKGMPLSEFWTHASAEESAGLDASPSYWENVFRTNSQTAYNAGRAAEFARTQPEYLEFIGIEDGRQTEICRIRSGTILPATHPFWKQNWPPLHFRCRSTVRAVFQEEVDLLREADPKWTSTPETKIATDPAAQGFGANPIATGSFYKLTPKMIERAEAYGILDDIKALGKSLGLRYDAVTLSTIAKEKGLTSITKTIPASKEERALLRKEAKGKLTDLQGQSFVNAKLKEPVTLDRTGIDHAVTFAGDPVKLAVLDHIPEIIKSASSFTVEPEIHGNPNFTEVLRGKAAIEVNGERNLFAVILKRKKDGSLVFYDLLPWEQK